MKVFRLTFIGLALTFCLLTCIGSSNVEAAEFLGDFCWTCTHDVGSCGTLKLGVFHMGGGHYSLSGVATNPPFEPAIFHGNAEFVGNNIQVILVNANSDTTHAWHELHHCVLNPTTMNGTCKGVDVDVTTTNVHSIENDSATLTFVNCP